MNQSQQVDSTQNSGQDKELLEIINKIQVHYDYLLTYRTLTEEKAKNLITKKDDSDKLMDTFFGLQEIYGIFIGLHPESIYAPQFKQSSEVYDRMMKVVDEITRLITNALQIWQVITSNIKSYTQSGRYCYNYLTYQFQGNSFHGFILSILNNTAIVLSFLKNLNKAEIIKGKQSSLRAGTMTKDIDTEKPPE